MPAVRVLVVDDSAAMRALFSDLLDNARGVEVCGVAANADQAREKISELRPDVVTLDVEMPGTSGMELLAELMETQPLPVIMLSSITQGGSGTAQRALELGAVHCFPKPLHSSQEQFDATVAKLGEIVVKAANGELPAGGTGEDSRGTGANYVSDGSIVAIASGSVGIETARELLAAYPAQCPPTVIVVDADADHVAKAIDAMRGSVACEVRYFEDGLELKSGRACIALAEGYHVVVEAGDPPRLRQVDRDPIDGARPSADLLFGSLARTGVASVCGLLVGTGSDGVNGLQLLEQSGARTFVQKPADYMPADRYDAVRRAGLKAEKLEGASIAQHLLGSTAMGEALAAA